MLSLKSSNSSNSIKYRKKKLSSIRVGSMYNLLLWIDFTDNRSVFNDDMSTKAAADDAIFAVANKANDPRFGKAGNKGMGIALKQPTISKRPLFRIPTDGTPSYAQFDGTNDEMEANKSQGNVDTNKLTDAVVNSSEMTVFLVIDHGTATPGHETVLSFIASDGLGGGDPLFFGTEMDHKYQVWASDQSDKSGAVYTDSDEAPTSRPSIWTIGLKGNGSSVFYRNGDTSDGVTDGASKSHVYNFTTNSVDNRIRIGHGANPYSGKIYEILVYAEVLGAKQVTEIERLLKQKYASVL
jgi:hypothetical protein